MNPSHFNIHQVTESSPQNCRLRDNPDLTSEKVLFTNQDHYQTSSYPPLSGADHIEQHMFSRIPKIQNSIYTMGVRMKGLSIKKPINRYPLGI